MGGSPGLSIPRLKVLLDAHNVRRRRELTDLWLVIRHAQNSDENTPDSILPALTTAAHEVDDDGDEDGFDAVAMVRRSRQKNEGR